MALDALTQWVLSLWAAVASFLFHATHPLTRYLFSRPPNAPRITVTDTRYNRARVQVLPHLSSRFNVEQYEVQYRTPAGKWCPAGPGWGSRTSLVVAGLSAGTAYELRARARNARGTSTWGEATPTTTRQVPVEGGGAGPGYRWAQNATEVVITLQLPTDEYLDKRRFQLQLSSRWRQQEQLQQLRVSVLPPPVGMPTPHGERVLLQGDLGGRVRDWGEGSFWELVRSRLREGSTTEGSGGGQLVLTLEKMQRAASAKFDFWQSCFQGPEHPLIDTHRLARDGSDVMAPSVGAGPAGGPVTREDVMAQLRSRQGLMLNEEQMAALEGWQALHRNNSNKGDWRKMR